MADLDRRRNTGTDLGRRVSITVQNAEYSEIICVQNLQTNMRVLSCVATGLPCGRTNEKTCVRTSGGNLQMGDDILEYFPVLVDEIMVNSFKFGSFEFGHK